MSNIEQWPPLGKSHHPIIHFEVERFAFPNLINQTIKYQVGRGDYEGMRLFIKDVKWAELLHENLTVDQCWENIRNIVRQATDKFVPKQKIFQGKKKTRTYPSITT